MNTTIKYLGEWAAFREVGLSSLDRHVYAVKGAGAREVMDWIESQQLHFTATARWDHGRMLGLYVIFEKRAESAEYIERISTAHSMFHQRFSDAEGFDWQGPAKPILAGKSFMRRALAS